MESHTLQEQKNCHSVDLNVSIFHCFVRGVSVHYLHSSATELVHGRKKQCRYVYKDESCHNASAVTTLFCMMETEIFLYKI